MHSWLNGIHVCSKEGPPFPRGDNNNITKIHRLNLKSSSPEPIDQFQSNLAQLKHPCMGKGNSSFFFKWRTTLFFQRGDNNKVAKLKIFISKTTGPISTKRGQICVLIWSLSQVSEIFKTLLASHTLLFSTILGTMHLWLKGIQVVQMKDPALFKVG